MKKTIISIALVALFSPMAASAANSLVFNQEWSYAHLNTGLQSGYESEISAFDAITGTIWVAGKTGVDILDIATGSQIDFISTAGIGEINSVDIFNGTAAFAIQAPNRADNGVVSFYNTTTRNFLNGNAFNSSVEVGALPDMVKFTPDGTKLLVANEGTPNSYGAETQSSPVKQFGAAPNDPVGSVSIVDVSNQTVQTADFNGVPVSGTGIRTNIGMDFEPEYIGVNANSTTAFVTLQEHNAIGILDINTASFTEVVGLGTKDFSTPGNEIDPSDKDGIAGNFASHEVEGFYMPDAVDTYEVNGQTYLVMANEGDFREDDGDRTRAKDIGDGASAPLDRLRVDNTTSVVDNSTNQFDLFAPGGRSFSIRDANGDLIYDSGSILDRAAANAGIYDDGRSDDKGTEPESVEIYEINGKTYAFIGLERTTTSAIGIFDITDPLAVEFDQLLTIAGDISPEGLQVFDYLGTTYLSVANEVSNTTSLLAVAAVPEPKTYAMLVTGLALLGFAKRNKQA